MGGRIRHLVYNPPTLKLLSVCRIRQSISCLGENVELNLIEKLRTRDFDDLRDSNVPISLEYMCKYLYYLNIGRITLNDIFKLMLITSTLWYNIISVHKIVL